MTNSNIVHLNNFIETVAPWVHAYSSCGISFIAVAEDSGWTLLHGRFFLSARPLTVNQDFFRTKRIVAGHLSLPPSRDGHAALIMAMFQSGEVDSPMGKLTLRRGNEGSLSAFYNPFHAVGLTAQNRLAVLLIQGRSRFGLLEQPAVDWELRAAPVPYESLNELENAYLLGGYSGDSTAIEVVANHVVSVAADSRVSGTQADIAILTPAGLQLDQCRLGYRVVSNRVVVKRGSYSGSELSWSDEGLQRRGMGRLEIPQAAVIECFASYADCTQHYYWISDPGNFQNPLRMALQAVDTDLEVLRDYLFEEKKERKESRHFEHGIALLTWLLGFSTAQPGSTPRLSDAPDIFGITPKGDVLVIECTTGLLRTDNKLPKLVERTRAIRNSLDASGNRHVRVLPVIVTALELGSVQAEMPVAKGAGVSVATKETLRDLLNSTVGVSDPQGLFERMWTAVISEQTASDVSSA